MCKNSLSLKDQAIFRRFLNLTSHELSAYSFENIYSWSKLFEIKWRIIENSLCVFFKDAIGCYMGLAPLAKKVTPSIIDACFEIMDSFNKNKEISRIENIEEAALWDYRRPGFSLKEKFPDYLCDRAALSGLRGNSFKHKRSALNFFVKHYDYAYAPLTSRSRQSCLRLFKQWKQERNAHSQDNIYRGMLEDSHICLQQIFKHYRYLKFIGRTVVVNGSLRAFTLGFAVSKEIFCVAFEITDLSISGLSQFIFQRFCQELKEFRYINIMDDSGLENLKKVKLSYRPVRLIPSYIISRKSA